MVTHVEDIGWKVSSSGFQAKIIHMFLIDSENSNMIFLNSNLQVETIIFQQVSTTS